MKYFLVFVGKFAGGGKNVANKSKITEETKMRTAKILTLVFALVMAFTLAACANGDTNAPAPSPTQGGATSQDPTPDNGGDTTDPTPDDNDPADGDDSANDGGGGWSSGVFNADDVRAEDFTFTKSISGDTITITVYDKNLREDYAITEDSLIYYSLSVYAFKDFYGYDVFYFNAGSSSDNPGVLKESRFFASGYGENALNIDYGQRKITFTVKLNRLLTPGIDESWNDYEWMLEAFYSVDRFNGDLAEEVQSSGRMQIFETQ
ncbi:MAG: hypothetical protein LBI38_01780 [Oscillospiraceae bacterium]|nr:hypothetical protein [Oscillospiraceae bacterium]